MENEKSKNKERIKKQTSTKANYQNQIKNAIYKYNEFSIFSTYEEDISKFYCTICKKPKEFNGSKQSMEKHLVSIHLNMIQGPNEEYIEPETKHIDKVQKKKLRIKKTTSYINFFIIIYYLI